MKTKSNLLLKLMPWLASVLAVSTLSAADTARKIAPNDLLYIRVYGEPDMTAEKKVSAEGKINYTFVEEVVVAGKTTSEVEKELHDLLDKDWFVNPQVSVEVKQYELQYVTVTGQVGVPGRVDIPPDHQLDVIEAIGQARDFTRLANKKDIKLRKSKTGETTKYTYDQLQKLAQDGNKIVLEAGDVITVGESTF